MAYLLNDSEIFEEHVKLKFHCFIKMAVLEDKLNSQWIVVKWFKKLKLSKNGNTKDCAHNPTFLKENNS